MILVSDQARVSYLVNAKVGWVSVLIVVVRIIESV